MSAHTIEVIGSGCKKCKALHELTTEVSQELGFSGEVGYSTDVTKIIQMGVMSSPVLTVDGKPVLTGPLPEKEELKKILSASLIDEKKNEATESKSTSECTCGGKC